MPFTHRQQEKIVFQKFIFKCVTQLDFSGVPLNIYMLCLSFSFQYFVAGQKKIVKISVVFHN